MGRVKTGRMTPPTLTISEFGRRCGLSHKALRLYDLSGLLPPAQTDPVSGYRIYSPDQLDRARRISLLRQLDMPLATVAEVLAGSDEEAVARLDAWWATQEATMRDRRGSLAYLRALLLRAVEPGAQWSEAVGLREVPETKLASLRRDVDQQSLVETMQGSVREIREHLLADGARPTGEWWVIYHGLVTPDSEAPIEVCVPFTGTVDPAGSMVIRIEPAHAEAICTVARDDCYYPRVMLAYEAVESWVADTGRPTLGPPREVYFANWCDIAGDDPFMHVAQPVDRVGARVGSAR
jgi:DNA-binding transcriptional MerR regulator